MDDAPVAVAAFAGQVELETAVFARLVIVGEGHALFDQPFDGFAAMLDCEAHGVFAAQAAPGDQGVLDVGFDGVGIVQHRGDPALRPERGALGQLALAQYGNAKVRRQRQGKTEARGPAADHKYIVLKVLAHARIPENGALVYRTADLHNSARLRLRSASTPSAGSAITGTFPPNLALKEDVPALSAGARSARKGQGICPIQLS
ncbi:hypothetical protein D9M68_232940 [compost metagenome]